MNNHIKKLFSCCLDNRVVAIETNFSEFYKMVRNIEPDCRSDRWYINKFKEHDEFEQVIDDKVYYFQRLV